jgi:hypothetical protein
MAEIGDYLDCNPEPGTTTTLLGLTKEEIQRQNPYKKVQKMFFKQKFVQYRKGHTVINHHDSGHEK